MEQLWSPWRSKYIETFKDEDSNSNENICQKSCFFCDAVNQIKDDQSLLVVGRTELSVILMNRYPYNSGHILIAPKRHIGEFDLLEDDELFDIIKIKKTLIKIMRELNNPHGYNIGANLGRVSGAGVPDHIHFHIVPRWNGDTSFMTVVSDSRIISEDIEKTRRSLADAFKVFEKNNL